MTQKSKTLPLQEFKDQLAMQAHGMTLNQAHSKGICIACKEPAAPKIHTPGGHAEYRISGICEVCWDHMYGEMGDDPDDY